MSKKYNFDFIGKKNIYFTISCALIAIIATVSIVFGVLMDIQFKGGTIITYTYKEKVNETELKNLVEDTIKSKVSITHKKGINGSDSFDITLAGTKSLSSDKTNELSKAIEGKYSGNIELLESKSVDAIIGREFFMKSMVAVVFSALILVIYIGLRFKKISGWSAGVMAVVALLHDVTIAFGVFVIFRMPLDYNFIAVILTILGYSINDTIVIYDRIRENKRLYGNSLSIKELVNNSINESLSRTINTTVSTLIAMVTIVIVAYVSGVTSIISFALPMTIGLISGTYSTIFIAGPLWVMWQNHKQKKLSSHKH